MRIGMVALKFLLSPKKHAWTQRRTRGRGGNGEKKGLKNEKLAEITEENTTDMRMKRTKERTNEPGIAGNIRCLKRNGTHKMRKIIRLEGGEK